MKKLFLIRHAETDYTLQKKYCGYKNTPLNAKGIRQAKRLYHRFKNIKVDRIYSSDLGRAYQTAKIIFPNKNIFKKQSLREINFGKFCELTWEEASKRYPKIYKKWLSNPIDVRIPNGEAMLEFTERVKECFRKIYEKDLDKTVAIISHGGVVRIILLDILKEEVGLFWNIEQGTAAINIIDFRKGTPRVVKINDTSHLG